MRKYTLSTAALRMLQITALLLTAAVTLLSVAYLSPFKILMIVIISVCWTLGILFGGVILPLYFRRAVIYISSTEISFHSGVIFRTRQHLRVSSLQYISQITLPLSSISGFNFVTLHALGGTVVLPFLSKKDSEEIITLTDNRLQEE